MTPGPVEVWATFRDRRHQKGAPLAWKPVSAVAADAIVLNPAEARQEMLGFWRSAHGRFLLTC